MKTVFLATVGVFALARVNLAHAYQINGHYAELVSCDFEFSQVRGEWGHVGTYNVLGETWTIYFGQDYCEY